MFFFESIKFRVRRHIYLSCTDVLFVCKNILFFAFLFSGMKSFDLNLSFELKLSLCVAVEICFSSWWQQLIPGIGFLIDIGTICFLMVGGFFVITVSKILPWWLHWIKDIVSQVIWNVQCTKAVLGYVGCVIKKIHRNEEQLFH
jgi:hypothetical protein